jgi:hypothetical protein
MLPTALFTYAVVASALLPTTFAAIVGAWGVPVNIGLLIGAYVCIFPIAFVTNCVVAT